MNENCKSSLSEKINYIDLGVVIQECETELVQQPDSPDLGSNSQTDTSKKVSGRHFDSDDEAIATAEHFLTFFRSETLASTNKGSECSTTAGLSV